MAKVQTADASHGGGRRSRRGARVNTTLSEINVVPLVDVMLVLLIIFMVAAPMLQRGVEVNLPQGRRSQPIADDRVFVTVPISYRTDRKVYVGEDLIRAEVLTERVRQVMLRQDQKEVFLRGDGAVTVQELIEVMDRLKDGGVERVGLVTRLPERR
jgi:biopolymer transport protein ExbD